MMVERLYQVGIRQPGGEPWPLEVIQADIEYNELSTKQKAMQDLSDHRAEIYGHYQELLRVAWRDQRYAEVRKTLTELRRMLGTDAPQVIAWEQINARLDDALISLEREFAGDDRVLGRIYAALMGQPNNGEAGASAKAQLN